MGRKMRRLIFAPLLALMALLLVVQPMLAAGPVLAETSVNGERRYGLDCNDGVCRLELDLGIGAEMLPQGAWLTVMQSALQQLPGGLGFEIQDDVAISLPTGGLSLADADLVLTLDDAGKVATIRGSAMAPVPTFGLLGDWQVVTPARVSVGYDRGDALVALDAPLQADRRYFFVDAEAGMHLMTQGMAISSNAGQRLSFVIDFAQPLVYIDGKVTLYTDGQMAFIREALGPLGESAWMPTDLPLRQNMSVRVRGQIGRDVEPKLTVAGEYRMDSGMVGKWLQIDATPLLAEGQAMIGPDGLMLEGTARSSIQPEQLLDGGVQAQIFVPFDAPEIASLTVGGDFAAPIVGVDHAATATVAGEAGWVARTGTAAWQSVQHGWDQAGVVVQDGYARMSEGVGNSWSTTQEHVGNGWAFTQEQWCGMTGLCGADALEPTQVAVAK